MEPDLGDAISLSDARTTTERKLYSAVVVPVLMLGACSVHDRGFDAPLEVPASFTSVEAKSAGGTAWSDRWWESFSDPALDGLVEDALASNFDLATFRDRLVQARAIVRRERASLFPSLDYGAFAQQTRRDANRFQGEDLHGASAVGSYEVDVWQRNASITQSARFSEAIAREQLSAASITLAADIATTWYALAEQRGQAAVLEDQITTNETVLRVVRTRFGGGVVRASDVLRQERLLESTREQRASVQSRIEVLEHTLLVLLGRAPMIGLDGARDDLPELPPYPSLGLPAELMQRRPDVRSAYLAILESDESVAVAVADRYPSVSIGFEASTVEESLADLFDNWAAALSVDIVGPLFDAGRREAEVDRAQAFKAQRVNEFAQTVLESFRQVMDAISRERARTQQITLLESQLELAKRISERLNREYLNGDISYIDVLEALTTEQQLQRDLLSAEYLRIADRIELYRALGGAWAGIVPDEDDQNDQPEVSWEQML